MYPSEVYAAAIERLKQAKLVMNQAQLNPGVVDPDVGALDEVLEAYQPLFSPDHLPNLTEQEFRSFLLFENNRHWTGLHRQGPRICADMPYLRNALGILLDEQQPVETRYEFAIKHVYGMGRAIATAILLIAYPDKYGVWNAIAEGGLKTLDLWPRFDRGEPEGSRYVKINRIFHDLANELDVDLWTLDALWWYMNGELAPRIDTPVAESIGNYALSETQDESSQRFGLERHLHEFLRDNWNQTELGEEWDLYREPGNEEAGYEYPCKVGRIDLLAKHRTAASWLVVELKREQSSDVTLGQVLRYMGWVRQHLAEQGEEVRGLIISRTADDSLFYGVAEIPKVDLQLYEVKFRLKGAENIFSTG